MRPPRLDEAGYDPIEHAVEILAGGGVVAIPTDTLYGLAAGVDHSVAVERVFQLKGRSLGVALPILLGDSEQVSTYVRDVDDVTRDLVARFWPGPLTLVLPRSERVPPLVSGGRDTVALRVPDHAVPRALVRSLGQAITGTSANKSGKTGLATAAAVRTEFGDKVDLIINGRATPLGRPSTVLDLSHGQPRILRQGAVTQREIEEVCGKLRPI